MSNAAKWWMQQVHALPCSACGSNVGVIAHHPRDGALGRKFGRKSHDCLVIALCGSCHDLLHGGIRTFERQHGEEWELLARTVEGMARRMMR